VAKIGKQCIKYNEGADWVLAFKKCVLEVKKINPHYRYGGTWKL
tara:strand:- start:218 stop:349 length:132 start_codon:yes stop_codon:yes gene_type:complete